MNSANVYILLCIALLIQPAMAQRVVPPLLPDVATSGLYRVTNAFPQLTYGRGIVGFAAPPGRTNELYYYDRPGRAYVITNFASPTRSVFLDLQDVNRATGDGGFIGMVFHPNFAQNRYFYVFYAPTNFVDGKMYNRLSRFETDPANPLVALRSSEQILFDLEDESSILHNGGDLHFGPDGYLYVTMGDEGGQGDQFENSQRIDKDPYSAILRIDVDARPGSLAPNPHPSFRGNFRIPPDNPYIGATNFNGRPVSPGAVRTEFWAVGFRSPHRMSIDALTGEIYLGDVGGDRVEEVDRVVKGGNYGWSYFEGALRNPDQPTLPAGVTFNPPLHAYGRTGLNPDYEGRASIGGLVYRGTRYPELYGKYVFGDYISKHIWAITFQPAGGYTIDRLVTAENGPTHFGIDPATGEILIASNLDIVRLVRNPTVVTPAFPPTLSSVGTFSNLGSMTVTNGVTPYQVASPFWSDHAVKQRWFFFQDSASKISRSETDQWSFPAGMVWMKHFDLELVRGDPSSRRRIETRFTVKTSDSIYGLTYRWRADGSDADLVPEGGMNEDFAINEGGVSRTQRWRYPSRSECLSCHNRVAGFALGFSTQQLNRDVPSSSGPTNQLSLLGSLGVFAQPFTNPQALPRLAAVEDTTATLQHRFKSYLDANCAYCHQPFGPGRGTWDGRLSTPIELSGLINGQPLDTLGIPGARVIKPGNVEASILWQRVANMGVHHMPPLATSEINAAGADLVRNFILNYAPAQQVRTVWQVGSIAPPGSSVASAFAEFGPQNFFNDAAPGRVTRLPGDPLYVSTTNPGPDDDFYFAGYYPPGFNNGLSVLSVPNDEPASVWEAHLTTGDRTNRVHFTLGESQVVTGARLLVSFKLLNGSSRVSGVTQPGFAQHDILVRFKNADAFSTVVYSNRLTQATEVQLDLPATQLNASAGPNSVEFVRTGPDSANSAELISFDYVRIESVPAPNADFALNPVGPLSVNESTPLTLQLGAASATPPAGLLVFSLISGPPGLTISPAGVVNWIPTEAQGPSTYTVVASVADSGAPARTASRSFSVIVNEVNLAPVLNTPVPIPAQVLVPYAVTLTATDPDVPANALTFGLVSGPLGMTVSPAGFLSWTPAASQRVGTETVTVSVTDNGTPAMTGTGQFTVTVRDALEGVTRNLWQIGVDNDPLVAPYSPSGEFSIENGRNDVRPGVVTRSAGDPQFSAANNPGADDDFYFAGVYPPGFNGLTATLGVPNDEPSVAWERALTPGDRTNRFHAVLGPGHVMAGSRFRLAFEWVNGGFMTGGVVQPGFGDHDIAVRFRNGSGAATELFAHRVSQTTNLVLEFTAAAVGALAGANTIEMVRSGPSQEGSGYWIQYDYVRLEAIPATNAPNTRPVWAAVTGPMIDELVPYTMTLVATDSDVPAQTLTYSVVSGPAGLAVSGAGVLTWTPSELQGPGSHTVVVRATDNGSTALSAEVSFVIGVREANTRPVWAAVTGPMIDELVPYTMTLAATDADVPVQPLTYSVVSGPAGLAVSGAGVLTWTPSELQGPGNHTAVVRATDNGSPALSAEVSLVIGVREVNTRPVWAAVPSPTIDELVPYTMTLVATDSDVPAQTLTYLVVSGPAGLTVSPAGVLSWTPTELQGPGSHTVVVRATDNGSPALSAEVSFAIGVREVNLAPALVAPVLVPAQILVPYAVTLTATDPDVPANALTFGLVSGPLGMTVSPAGVLSWTPAASQRVGTETVTVSVTDNGTPAMTGTGQFTVTVRDALEGVARNLWQLGVDNDPLVAPYSPSGEFSIENGRNDAAPGVVTRSTGDPQYSAANNPGADDDFYFAGQYPVGFNGLTVALSVPNDEPATAWERAHTLGDRTNRIHFVASAAQVAAGSVFRLSLELVYGGVVVGSAVQPGFGDHDMVIRFRNGSGVATELFVQRVSQTTNIVINFPAATVGAVAGANTIEIVRTGPAAAETFYWIQYDYVRLEAFPATNGTNTRPVWAAVPGPTIDELAPYTTTLVATDADVPAQTLTYSLVSGPTGLAVSGAGVLTWTPTELQGPGSHTVVVRATDNGSPALSAEVSFVLGVREVNQAPVLVAPVLVPAQVLVPYGVTLTATDADVPANALTFGLVSGPLGMTVSPAGVLSWTPAASQRSGTETVTVSVTDNGTPALGDTRSFTVTVNEVANAVTRTLWQIGVDNDPLVAPYSPSGEFSIENGRNDARPGVVTRSAGDPQFSAANNPGADDDFYFAGVFPPGFNGLTATLGVPNDEPSVAWERALTPGDRTNRIHVVLGPGHVTAGSRFRLAFEWVNGGVITGGVVQPGFGDHDIAVRFRNGSGAATELFAQRVSQATNMVLEFTAAAVGALAGPNTIEMVRSGPSQEGSGYWIQYDYVRLEAIPATNAPNTRPVWAAVTGPAIDELVPYTTTLVATDSDVPAQTLTYSVVSGPAGLAVSGAGVLTWTPSELQGPGSHTVVVRATDNGSPALSAEVSFVIAVREVNLAPVLVAPVLPPAQVLVPYLVTLTATDPDVPANALTFGLVSGPLGMTVSPAGVLSWTPTVSQRAGTYPVVVQVRDNGTPALDATRSFNVTVNDGVDAVARTVWQIGVDNDPLVAPYSPSGEFSIENGQNDASPGVVTRSAGDPQYSAVNNPGADDDFYFAGQYPVGFNGLTVPLSVPNDEPAMAWERAHTVGDRTNRVHFVASATQVASGSVFRLSLELVFGGVAVEGVVQPGFGDHDMVIRFRNGLGVATELFAQRVSQTTNIVINFPAATVGAVAGANTMEIVRTGPAMAGASHWIVYDYVRLEAFPATIAPNTRPVWAAVTGPAIDELVPYTTTLVATDSDVPVQTLTYSVVSGPAGLTVSPAGVLSWTPTELQGPGNHAVVVRATDNGSPALSAEVSFVIGVREVNLAPVLVAPVLPPAQVLAPYGVTLTATDGDVPANALTFGLVSGPLGMTVSPAGVLSWTPAASQRAGTYAVVVQVGDNGTPALGDTRSFNVTVNDGIDGVVTRNLWQIGVDDGPLLAPYSPSGEFGIENGRNDAAPGVVTRSAGDPQYSAANNPGADDDFYFAGQYPAGFNGLTVPLSVPNDEPAMAWERAHTVGDRTNRIHFVASAAQVAAGSVFRLSLELVFGGVAVGSTVQPGFGDHDMVIRLRNGLGVATELFVQRVTQTTNIVINFPAAAMGAMAGANTIEIVRTGPAMAGSSYWIVYDYVRLEAFPATNGTNTRPVWAAVPSPTIDELAPYTMTLVATDADVPAQTLTYSLVSGPPGLRVAAGGILSWFPLEVQGPSTNPVVVMVADNGIPPENNTVAFTITVREVGPPRATWQIGIDAPPNSDSATTFGEFGPANGLNDLAPGVVTRRSTDPLFIAESNPGADDDYYFEGFYPVGFNSLTSGLSVFEDEAWSGWERNHTLADRTNRFHFHLDPSQVTASSALRLFAEFPMGGFMINGVMQTGIGDHDLLVQFRNGVGVTTSLFFGRLSTISNVVVEFAPTAVRATTGENSIELIRTGPELAGRIYWLQYDFVRLESVEAPPPSASSAGGVRRLNEDIPDPADSLRVGLTTVQGVEYLTIHFERREPPVDGGRSAVEVSDDLVQWTSEGVEVVDSVLTGSLQTVTVRDSKPLKDEGTRFFRLRTGNW